MGLTLSIITFLGILYLISNRKKTKDEIEIDKKYNNIVEKQKDIKIFNYLENDNEEYKISPTTGLPMISDSTDVDGNFLGFKND
ncbi:hypothetical protein [Aliarcobacter skirrowii]|uniref:hypothetical protein n=1 Tax=Aliarcobacter skirrowii TaxID=28200 RepID=UPI0029AFF670|nr:hypothetical protein [Aliarcobacter skirrowii]MDX4028415.1 hypothetical protein [Aliarcobacter skirrowii]